MIDFIGDIHGYADELSELLAKLGYKKVNGIFSHPTRKVFFLGDFIDRGPKIIETLEIVKAMVDAKNAFAIMGNHEYNALCFHLQKPEGGHLRKHSIKNILQHYDTLQQFQNRQEDYEMYLEWFRTLPLYFENEYFRAVHACWDDRNINILKEQLTDGKLSDDNMYYSTKKETLLHKAVEETLKGKEIKMPNNLHFFDKDGNKRSEIRIKWWENPVENTYKTYSVIHIENLPEMAIDKKMIAYSDFYQENEKPVFFGHYWLKGEPKITKHNVCCLDYSMAKGGNLVAYRFGNEASFSGDKIEYV